MPRLSTVVLLSAATLLVTSAFQSASAQNWNSNRGFDSYLELFVDSQGRRFLVDPDSGEVVGRANRNARFTHRDKRRAQREFRRNHRLSNWDREDDFYVEDDFFNLKQRDNRRQRRLHQADRDELRETVRRRNGNRGRFLDEFDNDDNIIVGSTRRYDEVTSDQGKQRTRRVGRDFRQPLDENNNQLASLPVGRAPVQRSVPIEGIAKPKINAEQIASLQVVLDREGFSPGVIDGLWGSNLARALVAYKKANPKAKDLTQLASLETIVEKSRQSVFTSYRITSADVSGPFVASVPIDYAKKARLAALSYTSAAEMLAERFHMSEAYLRKLNPGKRFDRAGTKITVIAPGQPVTRKVHYIVADKRRKQVQAFDRNGGIVASYPATIGSVSTPSPTGTHSIKRIALNPEYTYNPKKNFQQGNNTKILRIPPGPNGPVGSVWIALSKPTYGIHGTPDPSKIGKTNSNGCIRLTNWDAQELASLVREGVTVQFVE
ncbi:MAG: L,D-transpeptidase [Rhizobiaceae bacterium]